MKTLKTIGLGIALWGFTLLWPELNQWLTAPLLRRSIIGLSGLLLLDFVVQHLARLCQHHQAKPHPHRWGVA